MRNTRALISEYEACLDTQSTLDAERRDEIAEVLIARMEDGDAGAARWVEQYA